MHVLLFANLLTRIAGLFDGLVWRDGFFRGAVVASLAWIWVILYRHGKPIVPALLACLLFFPAPANARSDEFPTSAPAYQGVNANAPIPPKFHVRNEGGSDGAGLCVISSLLANGQYQGVPGLMPAKQSKFWQTAKGRPGGYGPDKLIRLLRETLPGEPYTSYTGYDTSVLNDWSAKGYPIGATMNTGALYNYQPIHHMVSLIHYKAGGWACYVDNNDPGVYHWVRSATYDKRWIDGIGWAMRLDRLPLRAQVGLALLIVAVAALAYHETAPQEVPANA